MGDSREELVRDRTPDAGAAAIADGETSAEAGSCAVPVGGSGGGALEASSTCASGSPGGRSPERISIASPSTSAPDGGA
ncbi:MAG: hypothetical protein MI919_13035, partial [Holophagales bacterium]|nr:hypothetical protein [Holophagales bacterium]